MEGEHEISKRDAGGNDLLTLFNPCNWMQCDWMQDVLHSTQIFSLLESVPTRHCT